MIESKQNKKLTLGILLTFIICIGSAILATYSTGPYGNYPNPGMHPGMIGPGTFNDSGLANPQWNIPGDLNVNDKIMASQYCDENGNNCKNINESGFGGADFYIVDRDNIDKQIFYDSNRINAISGGAWVFVGNNSFIIDRTDPADKNKNIKDIKLQADLKGYTGGTNHYIYLNVFLDGNLIWDMKTYGNAYGFEETFTNMINIISYPEGNHTLTWMIRCNSGSGYIDDRYVFKNRAVPLSYE